MTVKVFLLSRIEHFTLLPIVLLLCAHCSSAISMAQEKRTIEPVDDRPLIKREPFDRVVLNKKNDNAVLIVELIPFPDRRLPEKRLSTEKILLKVLSITSPSSNKSYDVPEEFQVVWGDIERIEFYEEMILQEANQQIVKYNFDEAYQTLAFLTQQYPNTSGLERSLQTFYFNNAGSLFQQRQFRRALSLLEDLHRLNPSYSSASGTSTVNKAMARVLDAIIGDLVKEEKYLSSRKFMDRIAKKYPNDQKKTVDLWQEKLQQLALVHEKDAREHLAANRAREARYSVRRLKEIWPATPGVASLLAEIQRTIPTIVVGVTDSSSTIDRRSLSDWAARRTGHLTQRTFSEFVGYGLDGGLYRSPFGSFEINESGTRLTLELSQESDKTSNITGYDISQYLFRLGNSATPQYNMQWKRLVSGIEIENVMQVHINLRHSHVLPQAMVQFPLYSALEQPPLWVTEYITHTLKDRTSEDAFFSANPSSKNSSSSRPPNIIERIFIDTNQATDALQRGEIDIVDRITPADAMRLSRDKNLVVKKYSLPTVHVLVPNTRKPPLSNRTFRRAIAYGINRPLILQQDLLRGIKLPDCQVVSGPFSPGVAGNETLGYAYAPEEKLKDRSYEPRIAISLVEMGRREIEAVATTQGKSIPARTPLIIGHLPHDIPRIACAKIALQLIPLNIPCSVLQLPPTFKVEPDGKWLLFSLDEISNKSLSSKRVPRVLREAFKRFGLRFSGVTTLSSVKNTNNTWLLTDKKRGITFELQKRDKKIAVLVNGDLLYAELAMWEPLIDAQRLFGPGGVAETTNPYINLALRDVEHAKNWEEVADQLHLLHRAVNDELVIIPLWQMINQFVHRSNISGIENNPIDLYQNVIQWKFVPPTQ